MMGNRSTSAPNICASRARARRCRAIRLTSERPSRGRRTSRFSKSFRSAITQSGSFSTICIRPASTAGITSSRSDETETPIGRIISTNWPARVLGADAYRSRVRRRVSTLLHDDRRADPDPVVEIDHVLIGQADAARRYRLPDLVGLVRTVNAIEARAEIDRACPHRIVRAARHMVREIGPAVQHLVRGCPVRPLALVAHLADATPGVAGGAYGDGIAQRLAVAEHEVEPALRRADHDRAGLL